MKYCKAMPFFWSIGLELLYSGNTDDISYNWLIWCRWPALTISNNPQPSLTFPDHLDCPRPSLTIPDHPRLSPTVSRSGLLWFALVWSCLRGSVEFLGGPWGSNLFSLTLYDFSGVLRSTGVHGGLWFFLRNQFVLHIGNWFQYSTCSNFYQIALM